MTSKIKAIILCKNRTVKERKVNSLEPFFKVRGNLYTVPKEAVNLICYADKPNNPHAELIYIEGDPIPVSTSSSLKSSEVLDAIVIKNALESAAQPRGFGMEILLDYLKSPGKIMVLAFIGIIVAAVIGGYLHF